MAVVVAAVALLPGSSSTGPAAASPGQLRKFYDQKLLLTASLQGNRCVDDYVTTYLVDPAQLPPDGIRCKPTGS